MLSKLEFNSLIDQLKHVSKILKIIRDENNPENRRYACELGADLLDHLYRDLVTINQDKLGMPNDYTGTLKEK
jgi:hypothetical protein